MENGIISLMENNGVEKLRAVCPVCSMIVSRKTRFNAVFKRRRFYFCCNDCKASFVNSPYKYTL